MAKGLQTGRLMKVADMELLRQGYNLELYSVT